MTATVLHCEDSGGGNDRCVFVFLHGFMGNARSFAPVVECLAKKSRCISFDLPGHGRSPFARSDRLRELQTMEGVARLILEDLERLEVGRFILYGYSMGGRVAQHAAMLDPARVEALVLESASFGIAETGRRRQRYIGDQRLLDGIGSQKDFEAFLAEWHRLPIFCTLAGTPLLEKLIREKLDNHPEELRKALKIMSVGNHPFLAERLAGLSIPIFYFCGAQDQAYMQLGGTMQEWLPSLTIRAFAGASHNVHVQFPAEIVRTLGAIAAKKIPDDNGQCLG